MHQIKELFGKFGVELTKQRIDAMAHLVMSFELRGTNPLTLHGQVLGVTPIVFLEQERHALFDLFGVTEYEVRSAISKVEYFQGRDFKVQSDPFNLFCIWLIHLSEVQIKDRSVRQNFSLGVAKYLHYKFFTSLVNHRFPHGADEAVMLAVINSLSRKFDIIEYGSWQRTIEARSLDLISDGKDPNRKVSIHHEAFVSAEPDDRFLRILSDVQTRIRDKVQIICNNYYDYHARGIKISSSAATGTNSEGEKFVVERASTYDAMITNTVADLANVNAFINLKALREVSSQFGSTSQALLRNALEQMSELAARQMAQTKPAPQQIVVDGKHIIVDMRALVTAIVQVSFRYCENNQIPMKKFRIWIALKNVYSSSRVDDADIKQIKDSVEYFIDTLGTISRAATKSSLRLSIIMYIIFKCLDYV